MKLYGIVLSWSTLVLCISARVIDLSNAVKQFSLEDPDLVIQANEVALAIANRGKELGGGQFGSTFAVNVPINGEAAVLKVVRSGPKYRPEDGVREARNLYTVQQLLGWGGDVAGVGGNPPNYYFVMRNMGVSQTTAEKQGMKNYSALIKDAVKRYADQFHMKHTDLNDGNFVYRQVNSVWRAEIIDWFVAEWLGPGAQPVNPLPAERVGAPRLSTAINRGEARDRVHMSITVEVDA